MIQSNACFACGLPRSYPCTPNGTQILPEMIPACGARSKPRVPLGMVSNKIKPWGQSDSTEDKLFALHAVGPGSIHKVPGACQEEFLERARSNPWGLLDVAQKPK